MQSEIPDFFHPLIRGWFHNRYQAPTDIQLKAWNAISEGRHVLMTAPTGSGKTLAAFLYAVDRLATGAWTPGTVRVLYISPLKALNTDIRNNLTAPLREIRRGFEEAGQSPPSIGVGVRSGDTSPQEKQRMLRRPPEIFITTPESLNILLTSAGGRKMLKGVACVILDEIHAVADSKRGTHLMSAVERLTRLSGEFQRIALSATVRPLSKIAEFCGGRRHSGEAEGSYAPRPFTILESEIRKQYDLRVTCPDVIHGDRSKPGWWRVLIDDFIGIIEAHRSTLFFANSRRFTEKLTRLINEDRPDTLAYSHHGSLSKEVRRVVEERMKKGELKAILATSSLELGIDIGELDEVVLIQAPFEISAAMQRLGRSGHAVQTVSRGSLYAVHPGDLIDEAACAYLVSKGAIEALNIPECPLDVLTQIILAMVCVEVWDLDALFAFLKTIYPYRDLTRAQYDSVIAMLAGKFSGSRIRELSPRVSVDAVDNTIQARKGQVFHLYLSGGTIPDRGYYVLRTRESGAVIGELDEEFVWERSVGDRFTLGTQSWRITRITDRAVEVDSSSGAGAMPPFWKGEKGGRSFHFSQAVLELLERLDGAPREEAETFLREEYRLDDTAVEMLFGFLEDQQRVTGVPLPHRYHLVIEHYNDPMNRSDMKQVILHTFWGGKLNLPWATAIKARWEQRTGYNLEVFSDNNCIVLNLPHEFSTQQVIDLVTPETLLESLKGSLDKTGFFGARFRENAGRALLLPRKGFRSRTPLWLNRMRSKKIYSGVARYADFPVTAETWRTCLQDDFDLPALAGMLEELQRGEIRISECFTRVPSPFSRGVIWQQTNLYMYSEDALGAGKARIPGDDIFDGILRNSNLRPLLPPELIRTYEGKTLGTAPGYTPDTPSDLLDLLKERVILAPEEWEDLQTAIVRDLGEEGRALLAGMAGKLHIDPDSGLVCARELSEAWYGALAEYENGSETLPSLFLQWLRNYGPLSPAMIVTLTGVSKTTVEALLVDLEEDLVSDVLVEGSADVRVCERETLEILLRIRRREARPDFDPLPAGQLALFLATLQGLVEKGDSREDLEEMMYRFEGYAAEAGQWERIIIPSRIAPYYGDWLDGFLSLDDMLCTGAGGKRMLFAFPETLPLFRDRTGGKRLAREVEALFPHRGGRFPIEALKQFSELTGSKVLELLWKGFAAGMAANTNFRSVRQAITAGFRVDAAPEKDSPLSQRREYLRSRRHRAFARDPLGEGQWFLCPEGEAAEDPLAMEEACRDKVRVVLKRYGILFRQLLDRELPGMRWRDLFRALKLMEFSGEVYSGSFFSGIPGLQFIAPEAFRRLQKGLDTGALYFVNAADPACLTGTGIPELTAELPERIPSAWIGYRGDRVLFVVRRKGRSIRFTENEEVLRGNNDAVTLLFALFRMELSRSFDSRKSVAIEEINGEPALEHPLAELLCEHGCRRGFKHLTYRSH